MKRILITFAALVIQFCLASSAQAQFGPPPLTALVQATVDRTQKEELGIRTFFKITHVFSGAQNLVGKTFAGWTWTSSHSASGFEIEPVPKVGENGIWPLINQFGDFGSSGYSIFNARSLDYPFPARENVSSRYQAAVSVAEAIERMEKASLAERTALLRPLIFDPVPEISAWAVGQIARTQEQEGVEFVRALLPDSRLSTRTLLVIDDKLDNSDRAWRDSPERVQLWNRCLESKDAELISVVLSGVANSINRSKLNGELVYNLLGKTIQNESLKNKDKVFILALVRSLFDRGLLQREPIQ